jgi:hypothetical protein
MRRSLWALSARSKPPQRPPKPPRQPIEPSAMAELFTPEQLSSWPPGYRPSPGVAHFLKRGGLPMRDVIEAREDLREDQSQEMRRDFAGDYRLWLRCQFEAFADRVNGDAASAKALRRFLSRDRLVPYRSIVELLGLPSLADRDIVGESRLLPGTGMDPKQVLAYRAHHASPRGYPFTPCATLQERVLECLADVRSLKDTVALADFPAAHNLMHVSYDSMGPMRYLTAQCADDLLLSAEFVNELALYLRERWEALATQAEKQKPIVVFFSNGRLGHELNETKLLPVKVATVHPAPRELRNKMALPRVPNTPASFHAAFPLQKRPVGDALALMEPAIVVAEPHSDRDWTAEWRGYHSVREVVLLGQVDGISMGSFTFPWLSHGVAPGPDTYWMYRDNYARMATEGAKHFMPTDAPYVMQKYEKLYVDRVSKWMLCSNDTPAAPHQSRCVSYRRLEVPVLPALKAKAKK